MQVLLRHDPNGRPSAAQVLGIRAMQPYVDAYVKRTQDLREKNCSSPMPRLCSLFLFVINLKIDRSSYVYESLLYQIKGSDNRLMRRKWWLALLL